MTSIFWDAEGVLLVDYLDKGHIITGACNAETATGENQADSAWKADDRSALQHTSKVAMAAIQICGFQLVEDPPYSPDLAPSDYYLFPEMK